MVRSVWAFTCGVLAIMALGGSSHAEAATVALTGIVTGNDQRVGFRAMVMKQAIEYNLVGIARNRPDDIVDFTLQGSQARLEQAIATIRDGTRKSSNIMVTTKPTAVDTTLDTFTIVDWTSTSRQITTPYTLVFTRRKSDAVISYGETKQAWHSILKATLKGDDLKKLGDED